MWQRAVLRTMSQCAALASRALASEKQKCSGSPKTKPPLGALRAHHLTERESARAPRSTGRERRRTGRISSRRASAASGLGNTIIDNSSNAVKRDCHSVTAIMRNRANVGNCNAHFNSLSFRYCQLAIETTSATFHVEFKLCCWFFTSTRCILSFLIRFAATTLRNSIIKAKNGTAQIKKKRNYSGTICIPTFRPYLWRFLARKDGAYRKERIRKRFFDSSSSLADVLSIDKGNIPIPLQSINKADLRRTLLLRCVRSSRHAHHHEALR